MVEKKNVGASWDMRTDDLRIKWAEARVQLEVMAALGRQSWWRLMTPLCQAPGHSTFPLLLPIILKMLFVFISCLGQEWFSHLGISMMDCLITAFSLNIPL